MDTQTLTSFLFWIQMIAFFAMCVVLPFRFVLHTGRFGKGVLLVWISSAAFSFCSVMFGQYLYLNIDKSLADSCFEGPQFLCLALLGWWQGMIVSGTAFVLYRRRKRLAKKQINVNSGQASP
jgi:ABC-type tungstate transport system substrate-binding protein